MVQFWYFRVYLGTVSCRLSLRMARMHIHWNLKKLAGMPAKITKYIILVSTLYSLMKFVWYLLYNFTGAFSTWAKVLSNGFAQNWPKTTISSLHNPVLRPSSSSPLPEQPVLDPQIVSFPAEKANSTDDRHSWCPVFVVLTPFQTDYNQDLLSARQQGYFPERRMAAKSSMTLKFSDEG